MPRKKINPISYYTDWDDCLYHLYYEFGRLGLDPRDALTPYQYDIFQDLKHGIGEAAVSELFEWWFYDIEALYAPERGPHHQVGQDRSGKRINKPALPKIELHVEITSTDNLSVQWLPVGWDYWNRRTSDDSDWRFWYHTRGSYERPNNELLFIHKVGVAVNRFKSQTRQTPNRIVNTILLQAAASLLKALKYRLRDHFDIRMVTDIFVEWQSTMGSKIHSRMVSWEIDNVDIRNTRHDFEKLDNFKKMMNFPVKEMIDALELSAKRGSLETVNARAAKVLRNAGHNIDSGQVRDYRNLIEKYKPEMLNFSDKKPESNDVVVPFRKPQDSGEFGNQD